MRATLNHPMGRDGRAGALTPANAVPRSSIEIHALAVYET